MSGLTPVALSLSAAEAEELVEAEAMALYERRERRRRKGVGNRRPRCQSCNKFMRSEARACESCGFLNGAGWVS